MIKKLLDIVFLLILGISLLVPVARLDTKKQSDIEKRKLADYKPIYRIDNKKIVLNMNWGSDVEAFLKDRFWGRMRMIKLDKTLHYYLSFRYAKLNSTLIDKKTKWIYEHLTAGGFNSKIQRQIISQLKSFNAYCKDRNIHFYVEPMPRKEMIYPPELLKYTLNDEAQAGIDLIRNESGVSFIFPLKELLEAKDDSEYLLYHKTDHHATNDGTYIGYKALMNEIQKDFSQIKPVEPKDFEYSYDTKVRADRGRKYTEGSACGLGGIDSSICKHFLNVNFRYWKHKNYNDLKVMETRTDDLIKTEYFYPKGAPFKIMVFGDSYTANLMHFLPFTFKEVYLIRTNGPKNIEKNDQFKLLKYYQKEIEKTKPDIIVIYMFYSLTGKLRDLTILN